MLRAVAVLVGLGALVSGQLAFGGANQAASWSVWVGEQQKPPAGTPKQVFLNQFFPGNLTINAGDKVTFSSVGFHTASYTAGKPFPPFLLTPKGAVYEGIADEAGEPFFFDGQQKFEYGLGLFVPAGPEDDHPAHVRELGRDRGPESDEARDGDVHVPAGGQVQDGVPDPPAGHGDERRRQAEGRCGSDDGGGRCACPGGDWTPPGRRRSRSSRRSRRRTRSTWVSRARRRPEEGRQSSTSSRT